MLKSKTVLAVSKQNQVSVVKNVLLLFIYLVRKNVFYVLDTFQIVLNALIHYFVQPANMDICLLIKLIVYQFHSIAQTIVFNVTIPCDLNAFHAYLITR